jgi:hypothetical protein
MRYQRWPPTADNIRNPVISIRYVELGINKLDWRELMCTLVMGDTRR